MTIGLTFPVLNSKRLKSVPWGVVEPHRQRAIKNHGQTLERLAARGGLSETELAAVLLDRDDATDDQANKALAHWLPAEKKDA